MKRVFKYETPAWGARLICLIFLVFSVMLNALSFTYEQWAGDSPPPFFKWFFLVLGLVAFLASIKPNRWKAWVYFSADTQGLKFPSKCPEDKETTWLRVPWKNVGKIKNEAVYGHHLETRISIELLISQHEVDSFFKLYSRTNKVLGNDVRRGDFFVIAYSKAFFQRVDVVVDTLNKMKSTNT